MTHAFFLDGHKAEPIANENGRFSRYNASCSQLPPGAQLPVRCHPHVDTLFLVEAGTVEFMVGGASSGVQAGNFVRVPAGVAYAYRNPGSEVARVLVRSSHPFPLRPVARVVVEIAA